LYRSCTACFAGFLIFAQLIVHLANPQLSIWIASVLPTIRPESGARVPPSFMLGGSGARTFGCWTKGLQCRSKTGSQMLAFEVSDLRGFLFRFIEVPFLSARHNDLFVIAAIRPTAVRLAPSRGRSGGDQTQPQRRSNRARRS
jgi:hypothetical protein